MVPKAQMWSLPQLECAGPGTNLPHGKITWGSRSLGLHGGLPGVCNRTADPPSQSTSYAPVWQSSHAETTWHSRDGTRILPNELAENPNTLEAVRGS